MINEINPDSVPEWVTDLLGETDLGPVIIGHALLEERLGDLIESHILSSEDSIKAHLAYLRNSKNRSNPVGSFYASMCYANSLGLINDIYAALEQLNTIRNAFGHYDQTKLELKQVDDIYEALPENVKKVVADFKESKYIPWHLMQYSEEKKSFIAITSALMVFLDLKIQTQLSSSKS
jgi:hypothetical protein